MESLSRPFHSRKLSNATTFSAKNAYDGAFSGHRNNYTGASPINVQDYREIFGSSPAASSIPMLNLSTLVEQSDAFNLNLNLQSSNSKPDYSKIFGGFRDEDVAVSYEEFFAGDKSRAPSSKTSSSPDSDHLSHPSSESLKHFNMSYNKITQKSKDGLDETRYVTELHAIPGFTRFIDEAVPPLMEDKKHESSADSSKRSKHDPGESLSEDKKFKTFDNVKVHLSTVSSPSASPISRKDYPKRSTAINSDSSRGPRGFSPAYIDEEVNMNSAASDSGAALKKAIEKAQESIRIAKESVGRKKKGLRSFSSKTFKDSLNVEGRVKDVTASEAQKCKDEVREVFERATTSSQGFSEVGKTRKYFMDSEKLFVAKKFIDEMHGKISESTKECSMSVESCNKIKDNTIVSGSAQVMDETECRPLETAEKDEYATLHPEAVDTEKRRIRSLDFLADQIYNISVDNYEGKIKATVVYNSTQVTGETVEVDMSRESKENKDEVRLSNAHEIVKELNSLSVSQKAEDEKRVPPEEVLEQECIENAEDIEMHRKNSDDDISDIGLEDENESKDDCTTDNTIQESKEGAQSCDDNLEESEASLQDDCEMKPEDNHRGERKGESSDNFSDQELDEILSGDDNVSEETYSADGIQVASNIVVDTHESCKVDMNDNNVETTQETDTCFAQIGTEEQSDSSSWEEEEEEEEQQQQQQQQQQSNIQLSQEEIPETESINEIQESQEPRYKTEKTMEDTKEMRTSEDEQKENEIRETGPSKAVGKENKERIDELAATELEREKDRLAVDRAIREARERARERVERAAVEKATEEIRQRMMADAREKACAEARERAERAAVEKATEEIRQRMRADAREKAAKASAQSKLRAERAAVERATSEARQRALEKAMSIKPSQDSSGSNGTSSESALRKEKLEKDNKIMERTAKALAEKEKRDLLAQKEQAERNRLAENLDADIKKWSIGKDGNLRALLSTLHNILGSESGWQPVTLAEIVATSAVKKAYRKATLCVHPDKLQQRGASIQHKYICEKVFDLLKAAWNKFNSEKR